MKLKAFLQGLLACVLLLTTGCGVQSPASSQLEVSQHCRDGMQLAEHETDYEESERLLRETLSKCRTAEEWITALKAHPGAIGVTDESFINEEDIVLACWDNTALRVCQDAIATGRLPEPETGSTRESEATSTEPKTEVTTKRMIGVWFQWIPQEFSTEPAEADYLMTVFPHPNNQGDSGDMYSTHADNSDVMPSMDSGEFFEQIFHVAEGGSIYAVASVTRAPNEGRMSCLILDFENEKVLDYQEGQVGSLEPLDCWGFTYDNPDYTPGVPPVEVEFH